MWHNVYNFVANLLILLVVKIRISYEESLAVIIKLTVSHPQLEKLHQVLDHEENSWMYHWHQDKPAEKRFFVTLEESKAKMNDQRLPESPVPKYEVTLKVSASYVMAGGKHFRTPLSKLSKVLQAVGLCPNWENEAV